MATKTKESSNVVGKEKKAPPSSKTPTKSTKRSIMTPFISDKPVPNYLKPTISSLPESLKQSLLNRPPLDRRRSFDKPPSPSRLLKLHKQPSPSRQGLVSPSHVPRVRSLNRSNTLPVKRRNNVPSKPNSDRRMSRKSSPSPSDEADSKRPIEEVINVVETEGRNDHEENSNNNVEVERVEEKVSQLIPPQDVEENQNVDIEDHDDNEKLILLSPIVVSEEQEEIKDDADHEKEEEQEKIKDDDEHDKEEEQEKIKDADEHEKEINGSTTEVEVDEIKEEEEKEGEVISDNNIIVEEDHQKNEKEEEKEGGTSEGVNVEGEEEEHVEGSTEVEEVKVEEESTKPSKETHSQVSNDVIEETASKLLEERKNKVRALAGAFQTVIDYQTK